jgi:hypothetical protein
LSAGTALGMFFDDIMTYYYVSDTGTNLIFILDDNYNYLDKKTFVNANRMIAQNSSLYIAGNTTIWKTDKYLNILQTYNDSAAQYLNIFFHSIDNFIYLAPRGYTYIQAFDLNLVLNYTISTMPNNPSSFARYNNALYVGTIQGSVCVLLYMPGMSYQLYNVIYSFTVCFNTLIITSLVMDNCGFLAVNCREDNAVYLYYPNGTFLNYALATPSAPRYIGFDSNGYFVQISKLSISLYY